MADQTSTKAGAAPGGYAGDVDVKTAWDMLRGTPGAVLVDVRTRAEWAYVGVPDLSSLGKDVIFIEWQTFPDMAPNPQFLARVKEALAARGTRPEDPVLFICRSGARSRAAAIALTGEGFRACFNVAGGFEGDLDAERHRGRRGGWKAADLPWVQS